MHRVSSRAAIVKIAACFVSIFAFLYQPQVFAQAEVVDPVPVGGSSSRSSYAGGSEPQQQRTSNSAAANMSAEFYYQFQTLQQEVMELRGLVEEQAYEIKKLKQQRLDDYLDLDRRISNMRGGAAPADTNKSPASSTPLTSNAQPAPADELKRYRDAIDLLLKKQDQDGAIHALNQHLQDYPNGRYAANAQYWLGETYLLKGDLEQARTWFSKLINEYPSHNKVSDAKFKLAKVYDQQGNKAKARELMQEVAQSGSSAAGLAKDYLSKL